MNKKLIALAVAAASVAPAAMAQTANPVTLYGRVYVTFEVVEAKSGTAPQPSRNRVSDNSSLLGVRGTEDLGGGLKAFFQLETQFKPDSNDTTFANRNSGVGLQGGWGSILAGRWDSPHKVATTALDPFGDLTISGITAVANDRGNHNRRTQNVVQYWTPNWAGFTGRISYSANEGKTSTLSPDEIAASVQWTKNNLYLFLAYEQLNDQSATLSEQEALSIGGSFVLGPVKLGLMWQQFDKTGRTEKDTFFIPFTWTIGKHQVLATYTKAEDGGLTGVAAQPESEAWSIGYQYNFSRRTFFIASYTKVDNNNAADLTYGNFGANQLPNQAAGGSLGSDPQGFSFGIRHVF